MKDIYQISTPEERRGQGRLGQREKSNVEPSPAKLWPNAGRAIEYRWSVRLAPQ